MAPQVEIDRANSSKEYVGLVRVVGMIARHPEFPGKREALMECVGDIVERSRQGRLTPIERGELLSILLADDASA